MNETIQVNIMSLQGQMESMNNALQHLALNTRSEQTNLSTFGRGRRGRGGRSRGRANRNVGQNYQQPVFSTLQRHFPYTAHTLYIPQTPTQHFQTQATAQSFQMPRPPQGFQPNYNAGPQYQQQNIPPLAPQQHSQFCLSMNQNQMSPYKHYHNWNYCWTHRHNISDNHNSANCQNPAPGNVWQATKQYTAGGSTKGQHKIMYPIYNYSMSTLNSISQIACSSQHQCDTTYDDAKTVVTSNAKNANTT